MPGYWGLNAAPGSFLNRTVLLLEEMWVNNKYAFSVDQQLAKLSHGPCPPPPTIFFSSWSTLCCQEDLLTVCSFNSFMNPNSFVLMSWIWCHWRERGYQVVREEGSDGVCLFAGVAVTAFHGLGSSSNRNVFCHSSGGCKSEIKVSSWLVSLEASLCGL